MERLEKTMTPIADWLTRNKILSAIRDGFIITTPIVIIGSFFLLISNFPIPGYNEFMAGIFGENWTFNLDKVSTVAFSCISVMAALGIGYSYARELKQTNRILPAFTALVCFFILAPQSHPDFVNADGNAFSGFSFTHMGTQGIFLAMVVALVSVRVYSFAMDKKLTIKLPDGVPPAVMESFEALIPAGFAMVLAFITNIVIGMTSYETLHNFIYSILQAPLVNLGRLKLFEIVYQFLSSLFWFFGINGPAVTNTIFAPIHKALTLENYEAFQAGLEMTNVFTQGFSDFFGNFGGGGSTLGLVIMMSFMAKSERMRTLGKLSLPAGIFGINEPIIFGLPIVLNPVMLIPFLLCPILNIVVAMIATNVGFIPITSGMQLPWTTPILFSGFLITGSVNAVILQFLMLLMNMAVYYPFFRILDKQFLAEENSKVEDIDEIDELSFDDLDIDDL
ncbi:PTS sugar transporter subunit IIC [Anaerococcus provencensis]|uniref:PTS sugar transporter subunit IIC n=1 Tax=Anaerococcus provencensis TaxID=938293 RepID=UPI0002F95F64|nr:PTS transporter subunit EIIC [Anaerococcus provencensis]